MEITAAALAAMIVETPGFRFLELEKFQETERLAGIDPSAPKLGYIELDSAATMFYTYEYGFAGMLAETSSFRIAEFDVSEAALRGYAAIFRHFKNAAETEESVACWVRPEQKTDLEKRVRRMNQHIARLLEIQKQKLMP